jgi:hypothetical protein
MSTPEPNDKPMNIAQDVTDIAALQAEIRRLAAQNNFLLSQVAANVDAEFIPPLHQIDYNYRTKAFQDRPLAGAHSSAFARHLIIPVHPPRFGYLVNAFANIATGPGDEDVLLVLVVTSAMEREMLRHYLDLTGATFPVAFEVVSAIEICEQMNLQSIPEQIKTNRHNSIVNVKKVIAIYRSLCIGADEIVCIDSDIVFLSHVASIFDRLEESFRKKLVISGHIGMAQNIVRESASIFPRREELEILRLSEDGSLYSWFFDAPYFPKYETERFFAHLCSYRNGIEGLINSMTWGTFEHLLFQYYLLLKEGFHVLDIRSVTGDRVPDDLWLTEVLAVIDTFGYRPIWAQVGGMITYMTPELVRRVEKEFLVGMHVDRVPARLG